MIEMRDAKTKFDVCVSCGSDADVKTFYIGAPDNNKTVLGLCRRCREVLARKLIVELLPEDAVDAL